MHISWSNHSYSRWNATQEDDPKKPKKIPKRAVSANQRKVTISNLEKYYIPKLSSLNIEDALRVGVRFNN